MVHDRKEVSEGMTTYIDGEDEDDGPPLGTKDLAVLRAIQVLPELGQHINLKNICMWTTLEAQEVFSILTFLEQHGYVEEGKIH